MMVTSLYSLTHQKIRLDQDLFDILGVRIWNQARIPIRVVVNHKIETLITSQVQRDLRRKSLLK